MSKNAKTKNKIKRDAAKRARKAAKQLQYQKWAEQGKNTKSKRFMSRVKSIRCSTVSHPYGRCGNPACDKCFETNFNQFISKGKPKGMPQWMYLRWTKTQALRP